MSCEQTKKSVKSLDGVFGGYEKAVDAAFAKMGEKLQKWDKKGWFVPTKLQNELSDFLNEYQASKNTIYQSADTVKQFLDTFSKDESANIVKALNGDIKKESLKGTTLEAYKRLRALIDHNSDELVKTGLLDEKARVKDYLHRYYEKYLDDMGKVQRLFHDKKFARKDLSYEERIGLGMIEDASYVVPRTLAEQRVQLLKGKLLENVNEKFGADTKVNENYVQIDKTDVGGGVLKYGALSGRFVPKEVKAMLDNAHILKEELGVAEKYLYPVIDHIKLNMTVKNPVTHVYNILSNIQLSALNGTLGNVGRMLHMMKNDRAKFDAIVKELEPFGLDSALKDMGDVKLFTNNKTVNVFMSLIKNAYMSEDSAVGKGMRNVYDWEDKIFKIAAYDKLKSDKEIELGRALNDGEKMAVYKEAVAPFGNYSTPLPAVFRWADKTGLSPFLHYTYKSTPAVAKLIAKHPLKYAFIQLALLETGASIWDNDEDALKPDWAGKDAKVNLFGAKDWVRFSNGWYWNAGRMMPGMKFGAIDLSGGIWGGAIRIIGGQTPLGYTIGSKYDNEAEQTWDRVAALAENYAPSMSFGRYGQRVAKMLTGNDPKNYYGENMGVDELGGRILGVRQFNESKEVKKKVNEAKSRLKHFLETDPSNAVKYQKEYDDTMRNIEAQARAKSVEMPREKTTLSKKGFIKPIMPRQMVKLD